MSPATDVICRRDAGGDVSTNVERSMTLHSPDGFEFGYAGSGPADLALNILLPLVGPCEAIRLHQAFKDAFVAKLPRAGGVIPAADIEDWLRRHTDDRAPSGLKPLHAQAYHR